MLIFRGVAVQKKHIIISFKETQPTSAAWMIMVSTLSGENFNLNRDLGGNHQTGEISGCREKNMSVINL